MKTAQHNNTEMIGTRKASTVFSEGMTFEDVFVVVDPMRIVNHKVMTHVPTNLYDSYLKRDLEDGIKNGLKPFRAPIMDPSEEDGKIVYKFGNKPACGYIGKEWDKIAINFMPERNSRLGTEEHRAALLGELLMYLVDEESYSVEDAWEAVTRKAKKLGHFYGGDVADEAHPTGSDKVGRFYDWANTEKFIRRTSWGNFFLRASSHFYHSLSLTHPEDDQICMLNDLRKWAMESVGWIITDV